jgi:transglutaminase-like putative cysteine protease
MNQVERDRTERVISAAQRQIWVTWQREGIHKYPAALTDPNLADVQFLGYPHRHIFHFRVWIDVFHNDRDLEFIQFKRWCESLYSSNNSVLSLDYKSCEMIADDLYIQIADRYPGRVVHIEVSEDGENGAVIRYELTKPLNNIVI